MFTNVRAKVHDPVAVARGLHLAKVHSLAALETVLVSPVDPACARATATAGVPAVARVGSPILLLSLVVTGHHTLLLH